MTLDHLLNNHAVELWGVTPLTDTFQDAGGYKCIAFCLPYDQAAVAALPNDDLISRSKAELTERARVIYRAIATTLKECSFQSFDEVSEELRLREKRVSQKVFAYLAGLGWIGKSSLLITNEYGPRVRLCTIFTQGDLEVTSRSRVGECGECLACAKACPAGAINKNGYDVNKCKQVVTDQKGETKTFCGLCMRACPQGIANSPVW
jgi:epoxyqueuosine reductase QueG